jgi:hypothetical protein
LTTRAAALPPGLYAGYQRGSARGDKDRRRDASLAVGASSFAVAQGSSAGNAAASGGSGTHQSAQKTGSAANDQKVLHNQNGYRPMRRQ